jgi:hypothetical protein
MVPDSLDVQDVPGLKPGDWAFVYSNRNAAPNDLEVTEMEAFYNAQGLGIPRFFGQVESITSEYERDFTGNLRRRHTITIREWSAFLTIPVRFDTFAIKWLNSQQDAPQDTSTVAQGVLNGGIANAADQSAADSVATMLDVSQKLFTPFGIAHVILKFIDGISSNNELEDVQSFNTKLPKVAVRLPQVPPDVFALAGVPAASANVDRPFSSGLMTVVTGVQTKPIRNDGTWHGVFGPGEFSAFGAGDSFSQDPKDRPKAPGFSAFYSQGLSAWEIIQRYCDTNINEIFTDIAYETVGDKIVPKPFLCIRDKPFALRALTSNPNFNFDGEWTIYDDLPRIYLDSAYILKATFTRTSAGSYNYIRFNFSTQELGNKETAKALSELSVINNQAEQLRFGGIEHQLGTNYFSVDKTGEQISPANALEQASGTSKTPWFQKLRAIVNIWYKYLHAMPSGTLITKDHNIALTVGSNLQFNLGGLLLCGHIEAISMQYSVGEDGNHHTHYAISLSRIVGVKEDGSFTVINSKTFSNLRRS